MRIVESRDARFIENEEVSGSQEPQNVEIKETKVECILPLSSFKVVNHIIK